MDSFYDFRWKLELTNRCNFACLHCLRANNMAANADLPVSLYERLLREGRPYHSSQVAFSGGEPTLHPELQDLLAVTARYDCAFSIATNGWTFEQILPLFLQYRQYLKMVVFSLDGAETTTHDAIRQQPGSYERVLNACILCYYKQIPFGLTMTIHRLNLPEIDAMISLASKLGAAQLRFECAQLTPALVEKHLALSPAERRQLDAKLQALPATDSLSVFQAFDLWLANPFFPCATVQMGGVLMDYAGHIRFCCQLPRHPDEIAPALPDVMGSLHDHSLGELHRRFIHTVATFQEEKLKRITAGNLTENEYFPCYYCAKYFHKLDWLSNFPDSEWNSSKNIL